MTYLLDTNAVSELMKPRPDAVFAAWFQREPESRLFTSVLTIGEIAKGMHQTGDELRRARVRSWLDHEQKPRFGGRLLAVDLATAEVWGDITGAGASRGEPLPVMDA